MADKQGSGKVKTQECLDKEEIARLRDELQAALERNIAAYAMITALEQGLAQRDRWLAEKRHDLKQERIGHEAIMAYAIRLKRALRPLRDYVTGAEEARAFLPLSRLVDAANNALASFPAVTPPPGPTGPRDIVNILLTLLDYTNRCLQHGEYKTAWIWYDLCCHIWVTVDYRGRNIPDDTEGFAEYKTTLRATQAALQAAKKGEP